MITASPRSSKTATIQDPQSHSIAAYDAYELQHSSSVELKEEYASNDSALSAPRSGLQAAVDKAVALGIDEKCMWHFARALRGVTNEYSEMCLKDRTEALKQPLNLWWAKVFPNEPIHGNQEYEMYLLDLEVCYRKARVPLGEGAFSTALKNAPPLPEKPKLADRIDRLLHVCRELQKANKGKFFFLSYRDALSVIGLSNPYAVRNIYDLMIQKGTFVVLKQGGNKTMKSTHFKLVEKKQDGA